jgi:NADPH:quinone reductase-like Zn-dependent oxidoreductase
MRAVVITRHGPPEVLQVQERPDPQPGPGEVLVDVHAAGVNFADVMARQGLYPDAPKPPCVVGYEVAGVVIALGSGVRGVREGARVMAGTRFGGYAERVAVKARDTVPLPDSLTFEEGAAVPVCYATAWCALHRYGALQRGERVLVHAAAGGVGTAAMQFARAAGAEVWGTASPHKHEAVRAQGADHVLDYRRDDWHKDLPAFDLVLDPVGGRSHRVSYDLLRPGGRLVAYGASAVISGERRNLISAARAVVREPRFNLVKQMSESKSVIGLNMLRLWDEHGTLEPWIAPLRDRLADGTIRPLVAQAVPFDRAPEAHRLLHERRNIGKVVLTPVSA